MPSTPRAIQALVSLLPAQPGQVVYELGSGWGHVAIRLALQDPTWHVIGCETSPLPYLVSRLAASFVRLGNLELRKRNFMLERLEDADVIVCYLYPGAMVALKEKFEKSLKPGTWIVSNTFAIPGWTPLKTLHLDDLYHTPLYLYRRDKY